MARSHRYTEQSCVFEKYLYVYSKYWLVHWELSRSIEGFFSFFGIQHSQTSSVNRLLSLMTTALIQRV